MCPDFDDPHALISQELGARESRAYEELTVQALREALMGQPAGLVIMDEIELVGTRPKTLVVFRYHHHPSYVGRQADLGEGPRAETASLWEFAIDPKDQYSNGMMDSPPDLAAAIGSAFDAAELLLVDPVTLTAIGNPPKVFPRVMSDTMATQMQRRFEASRNSQGEPRGAPEKD